MTAIGFGIGLYCLKKKKQRYAKFSNDSTSERDTVGMMHGASGSMVWETNVIAHDHDRMLSEGAVEVRV